MKEIINVDFILFSLYKPFDQITVAKEKFV